MGLDRLGGNRTAAGDHEDGAARRDRGQGDGHITQHAARDRRRDMEHQRTVGKSMASCLCHRHLRVRQIVHLTALTIFVLQIDDAVDLVDSDALVACKAHVTQCISFSV